MASLIARESSMLLILSSVLRASISRLHHHCKGHSLSLSKKNATNPFHSTVEGVDGVNMADEFEPEPKVYLALTVPKFPNYFVINGVRGNWAAGTALPSVS